MPTSMKNRPAGAAPAAGAASRIAGSEALSLLQGYRWRLTEELTEVERQIPELESRLPANWPDHQVGITKGSGS